MLKESLITRTIEAIILTGHDRAGSWVRIFFEEFGRAYLLERRHISPPIFVRSHAQYVCQLLLVNGLWVRGKGRATSASFVPDWSADMAQN